MNRPYEQSPTQTDQDLILEAGSIGLGAIEGRMGDACIQSNRLTRDEVDAVVELQNRQHLRFGEAAIQLGLLTEKNVRELLDVQFNNASFSAREVMSRISPSLAILHAPDSEPAEAIKRLRSELLAHLREDICIAVAVLSPAKGEGKSYIAASLAIAFAQLNIKTMLIDANLREPTQHKLFGLPNQTGLSTILAKRSPSSLDVIPEIVPNFWVLGSGPPPPNPLEIITAPWFRRFIDPFFKQVSVIIVDTPAGNQWADGQMIAGQTGLALLVARKDVTQLSALKKFNDDLKYAGVEVLGVVFNQPSKNDALRQANRWLSDHSSRAEIWTHLKHLFRKSGS